MENFTYEAKEVKKQYETYEWDNVWIDHANDLSLKRVLYIGDSISCGTRNVATSLTKEKILFDGFGTSKGIDNPYFKDAIKLFAKQEGRRDAVIFNNGLHGWHLDKTKHIDKLIKDDSTNIRIDYKVSGIGSQSCGPMLLEKYQLKKEDIDFSFYIL